MASSSLATKKTFQIGITATERAALNAIKGNRTMTELILDIRKGLLDPIRLPDSAYEDNRWVAVHIHLTEEQADPLIADARQRGTTVSKAVRADISVRPPKRKQKDDYYPVNTRVREALTMLRATDAFAYTESWPESKAFIEVATVLLQRKALSITETKFA